MGSIAQKARGPSHQVSLQDWALYLLRFIITGDLRNEWRDFGGLSDQLPHLRIALHLGVAGNGPPPLPPCGPTGGYFLPDRYAAIAIGKK